MDILKITKQKQNNRPQRFLPGKSGNPNGRRRGVQNKFTRSAKEAFQIAFDEMGGSDALRVWAEKNPTEFYKLFARLIPTDITSVGEKITGIEVTVKKPT